MQYLNSPWPSNIMILSEKDGEVELISICFGIITGK